MSKQITKSIIVSSEANNLYETWLNFHNHPQFMENITSVTKNGPDTNQSVMEGP